MGSNLISRAQWQINQSHQQTLAVLGGLRLYEGFAWPHRETDLTAVLLYHYQIIDLSQKFRHFAGKTLLQSTVEVCQNVEALKRHRLDMQVKYKY